MSLTADCGDCRFWKRSLDDDEIGDCRRHRPLISEILLEMEMKEQKHCGREVIEQATRFPVTHFEEWCGDFEISARATATDDAAVARRIRLQRYREMDQANGRASQ